MSTVVDLYLLLMLLFSLHTGAMAICGWRLGLQVEEVRVGFGPQFFSIAMGNAKFSLGILPLGGSTKFAEPDEFTNDGTYAHFSDLGFWGRIVLFSIGNVVLVVSAVIAIAVPAVVFGRGLILVDEQLQAPMFALGPTSIGEAIQTAIYALRVQVFQQSEPAPLRQLVALSHETLLAWPAVFGIIAVVNAAFNMIPLPILNGGQIVIVTFEAVVGRPIRDERTSTLIAIGAIGALILTPLMWWRLLRY